MCRICTGRWIRERDARPDFCELGKHSSHPVYPWPIANANRTLEAMCNFPPSSQTLCNRNRRPPSPLMANDRETHSGHVFMEVRNGTFFRRNLPRHWVVVLFTPAMCNLNNLCKPCNLSPEATFKLPTHSSWVFAFGLLVPFIWPRFGGNSFMNRSRNADRYEYSFMARQPLWGPWMGLWFWSFSFIKYLWNFWWKYLCSVWQIISLCETDTNFLRPRWTESAIFIYAMGNVWVGLTFKDLGKPQGKDFRFCVKIREFISMNGNF